MSDVFPRRNLNPEAEEWGREVERRIQQAENKETGSAQSISGLNRASASGFQALAEQLQLLDQQVDRVNDLYGALPKADQQTTVASNFGLGSGWNNVAAVTFYPPMEGYMNVSVTAHGQLRSPSTTAIMGAHIRLVCAGETSPAMPGLPASPFGQWINNLMFGYGWRNVPVNPNTPVTIRAQVIPDDASAWPSGNDSMMALTAFATFTTLVN